MDRMKWKSPLGKVAGLLLLASVLAGASGTAAPTPSRAAEYVDESIVPLMLQRSGRHMDRTEENGDRLRSHYVTLSRAEGTPLDQTHRKLWTALLNHNTGESTAFRFIWRDLPQWAEKIRQERRESGLPLDGDFRWERDLLLRRADSRIVSFVECDTLREGYEGFVDPPQSLWGRNYDAQTGKQLTLSDVFPDTAALAGAIEKRLRLDYPDAPFTREGWSLDLEAKLRKGEEIVRSRQGGAMGTGAREGAVSWTLEPRGATFYFNPGEIAPERMGIYTATILFREHPELFLEDYRKGPAAYCMELLPDLPCRTLLGNGGSAALALYETPPGLTLSLSGRYFPDSQPATLPHPVLVCTKEGNSYLYVDCAAEPPRHELRVYELKEGAVSKKATAHRTLLKSGSSSANPFLYHVMTDPENFLLDTELPEAARDKSLTLPSRTGKDGMPEDK